MWEFGRECLQTERFDTKVPRVFLAAVEEIGGQFNFESLLRRAEIWESLDAMFTGYNRHPPPAEDLNDLRTRRVAVAWLAGRVNDAKRFAKDLEIGFNESALSRYRLDREDLQDYLSGKKLLSQRQLSRFIGDTRKGENMIAKRDNTIGQSTPVIRSSRAIYWFDNSVAVFLSAANFSVTIFSSF